MTLQEWAEARVRDVQTREFENSLYVNERKPLGGYGFASPWLAFFALLKVCKRVGWKKFGVAHGFDESGTYRLYVYHWNGLQAVVDYHQQVIRNAGWPTHLGAFVERCRAEVVLPPSNLYDVIADAYGDTLNPGRKSILPGVDRAELLAAYQKAAGQPDPAEIYLTWKDQALFERLQERREAARGLG